ncbi:MAG TPA: site-specific integrase [Bryobacteraceae bacterium]|jgi:site-specific recombinase XerD|nr:site-specific integrase [Bryobacteraceae bacterium]
MVFGGRICLRHAVDRQESAVSDWQHSFRKLFRLASIDGGHPYRFRDTFAVELLLKGVSMEDVSILLGHRSIKTTELKQVTLPGCERGKTVWTGMFG